MTSLILAAIVSLHSGLNPVNSVAGQVLAAEALTVNASASVAVKAVRSVTAYTNAYHDVTTPHTVFSFVYTNFDGNASIATNVLDQFSYADWVTTSGVSRIVGQVTPTRTNITETVFLTRLPSAKYLVTNDLVSVSASAHRGTGSPVATTYFFGGDMLVTGAGEDDLVTVIIK